VVLVLAAYAVVAHAGRRDALVGCLLLAIAATVALASDPSNDEASELTGLALFVLLPAGIGLSVQRRQLQAAAQERRADAKAAEAAAAVTAERARIARELHDVLAHGISVINVQASVALHLIEEQPEQARTALTAIKNVSKDALRDLRSVLAALRQPDEPPERAPAPSLANLDELVTRTAAGGLEVRTEIAGPLERLPASVDLAAFRILQESLTNVIRHAGTSNATVRVSHDGKMLVLEVEDDGRGMPSNGGAGLGTGIQGMRDRAAALGGAVDAGPRPGGGFRVFARLPLDGAG
jgi:signal transduction histidine kinase